MSDGHTKKVAWNKVPHMGLESRKTHAQSFSCVCVFLLLHSSMTEIYLCKLTRDDTKRVSEMKKKETKARRVYTRTRNIHELAPKLIESIPSKISQCEIQLKYCYDQSRSSIVIAAKQFLFSID